MTGQDVADAIALVWEELPGIIGDGWDDFVAALLSLLRRLDTAGPADPVTVEIVDLFARHGARERLAAAIAEISPTTTRGRRILGNPLFVERQRRMLVPVYYGTSRNDTGIDSPTGRYGKDRGGASYGVGWVSIPDDHKMGEMEKPRWWRLQFRKKPGDHVVLEDLKPLDRAGFVAGARSAAVTAPRPEALIFVHGYNVSFEQGISRAAQIAYDLHFKGIPMLYSWPSTGSMPLYNHDENEVRWSETLYRDFVDLCRTELGLDLVHIIAHSMGSRLVAETLERVTTSTSGAPLHSVVFAAPDIDAETFAQLAVEFSGGPQTCTLYASSNDYALVGSAKVHGRRRAGDSADEILVVAGVDSIDASEVDTGLLGHSYIGDGRTILSDVNRLLQGQRPEDRQLDAFVSQDGGRFWKIPG